MPAINAFTHRDWLMLGLVLLVAGAARFCYAGITEFRLDEATLSLLAQGAADGSVPLTGMPSSVGLPNTPISVYVMTIPYAISDSPLFATLFVAALNVVGVGLLWAIAHRYFSPRVGLFAGLLYAVNPYAVLYSRKIWAQEVHTPFFLAAVFIGLYGFVEGKRWAQVVCLPLMVFALQIHFAALVLLPVWLALVWLGRKRLAWWAVALSIAIAALTLVPYALGLNAALQENPGLLSNLTEGDDGSITLSNDALDSLLAFATAAPLTGEDALFVMDGWRQIAQFSGVILAGVLFFCGWVALFRRHLRLGLVVLAWVLLPLLAFTIAWTPVFPHYFIASIPVLLLLVALGADAVLRWLPRRANLLVTAVFGLVLAVQLTVWFSDLSLVNTNNSESFGTPMHHLLAVREALTDHDDVVVITDGVDIRYDQEPAIWTAMLHNRAACVRALSDDRFTLYPNGSFAALTAPNAPNNITRDQYTLDDAQQFDLREGEGAYYLSEFEMFDTPAPDFTLIDPATFDNGATLTGYALTDGVLSLEWSLPGDGDTDYQYFAHFVDASGEKIGQRDARFYPGGYWCGGDRLITRVDVAPPEGTVALRIGMYQLTPSGGFINSNVVNETGEVVTGWVEVPLAE